MLTRRKTDPLSMLTWGTGITCGLASAAGLLTWSWRGLGLAAAATLTLFALLMLAVAIFGKDG